MADAVTIPNKAYEAMRRRWDLIDALLGGTLAMRDAGKAWLPIEPAETEPSYQIRLERNVLYNGYKDTIDKLASKPFGKSVSIPKLGIEQLDKIQYNVDRTNKSLTQFGREIFTSAMNRGLTHVLVDYPEMPAGATKADESRMGIPTFVHIDPLQLIGWGTTYSESDGSPVLSHIRIREEFDTETASFERSKTVRYRVYYPDRWELFEDDGKGATRKIKEGVNTLGQIPLVTIYFNRTGFMQGEPCLEDLAWINLGHWQSSADQRNILRFARRAILFISGLDREDMDKPVTIGPNQVYRTKNPNAKMSVVEHSGSSISAGRRDLIDAEEKMEILGMQPSIQRSGNATATGKAIDEGRAVSDLEAWVELTEAGLTQCYGLAALWAKKTLPEDFKVDIFSDFNVLGRASAEKLDHLLKAVMANKISHRRYLVEIKRLGVISEAADIDDELSEAELDAEDNGLGLLTGNKADAKIDQTS